MAETHDTCALAGEIQVGAILDTQATLDIQRFALESHEVISGCPRFAGTRGGVRTPINGAIRTME